MLYLLNTTSGIQLLLTGTACPYCVRGLVRESIHFEKGAIKCVINIHRGNHKPLHEFLIIKMFI